ncbi:hypothetical protein LZG04_26685 [Saccharothrix sp. S26]|nr:hypothetical protein [Saccharothrix sp. S26]MCE6998358.1 hypothetical protein [Saccharothrix sp. S26]
MPAAVVVSRLSSSGSSPAETNTSRPCARSWGSRLVSTRSLAYEMAMSRSRLVLRSSRAEP